MRPKLQLMPKKQPIYAETLHELADLLYRMERKEISSISVCYVDRDGKSNSFASTSSAEQRYHLQLEMQDMSNRLTQ